jgi:tRNA(adenine34) deaminase
MSAPIVIHDDEHYMRQALREAERAFAADEVPIGAVIVCQDKIIARGHNLTERLNDVTAHAEMQAITSAAEHIGGKYLHECTLYVTLEPCVMCAGAMNWAHLGRIVFGAFDEKGGYRRIGRSLLLHPKTKVSGGILEAECSDLMKAFFRKKRAL